MVVPESIPEVSLFILLVSRKFPVINCIRRPDEFSFVAESDVFHDLFDRVPIVVQSSFQKLPASLWRNRNKSARPQVAVNNHWAFVGTRPNLV